MATTVEELDIALKLIGTSQVVGGLGEVNAALGKVGGGVNADQVVDSLGKIGTSLLVAGGAGAALFGAAIHTATDFQQSIANIGAVSGASAGDLARLAAEAQTLARDTTLAGVGASDAASAMEVLVKSGLSVDEVIGGAARGALLLASAGGIDFAAAATIAADAMHQFGLQAADVPHIADVFSAAANASSVDVTDLALSLKYVGPVAHDMGISLEETTATIAELGNAGIKADTAGTSLRTMLVNLVRPTKQMQAVMKEYGLSFFDAGGHMKDFAGIADELHRGLGNLTDQQRLAALEILFGKEALSGALTVYEGGSDTIRRYTDEVNQAGSAAAAGAARNNTAAGSLAQFKDSAEALGIALGTVALPALTDLAKRGTDVTNSLIGLDPQMQATIVNVGLAATGFLLLSGAMLKTAAAARELYTAVSAVATFLRLGTVLASVGDAALAAAPAIAGAAAVTVAAVGAAYLGTEAWRAYADANGITTQQFKEFKSTQDAAAFAVAHGATATNSAASEFVRYLDASRTVITSTDQMAEAWNRFINVQSLGAQNTQGLTLALTAQQQAQMAVNLDLGEGRRVGQQYNDTVGNLTAGAITLGAAMPTVGFGLRQAAVAIGDVEQGARLAGPALADFNTYGTQAQQAMNDNAAAIYRTVDAMNTLAPVAGLTAIGLKDVDYYGTGAQTRMNETASAALGAALAFDSANAALAGYNKTASQNAGFLATLQKEFDDLLAKRDGSKLSDTDQKRLSDDTAQLRDLDAKSGKGPLSAAEEQRRKDLRAEIAALQAKAKAGTPLTAAEQARLEQVSREIDFLNAQKGVITNQQQQGTSAAVDALIQQQASAGIADKAAAVAAAAGAAVAAIPKRAAPDTTNNAGILNDFTPRTTTVNLTINANSVTAATLAQEIYDALEPHLAGGGGRANLQ